jgi:hypothetical protein
VTHPGGVLDALSRLGRLAARSLLAALALVTVGVLAAAAAAATQTVTPDLPSRCDYPRYSAVQASDSDRAYCEWDDALEVPRDSQSGSPAANAPKISIALAETDRGILEATFIVDLPATHPLLDRIRRGETAEHPEALLHTVSGVIPAEGSLTWSRFALSEADRGWIRISSTSTKLDTTRAPRGLTELEIYLNEPGTVIVTLKTLTVVGVRRGFGQWTDDRISGRTASIRTESSGTLTLLVSSPDPVPDEVLLPSSSDESAQLLASAGAALREAGSSMLVVVPWLILLLATRADLLGRIGRMRPWRRAMTVTGVVISTHVVVVTVTAVSNVEATFTTVASKLRLSSVLYEGLGWNASTYPAVGGAVVVLIALLLIVVPAVVRSWPVLGSVRSSRPAPTGVPRRWTSATVAATAASVPTVILYLWLHPSSPPVSPWRPSSVIPAAAFVVLLTLAALARLILTAGLAGSLATVPLVPMAVAATALAGFATLTEGGGWLPWILRWAVWLAAGISAALAAVTLFSYAIVGARPPRRWWRWAVPAAAVLVIAGASSNDNRAVEWWQIQTLVLRIDGITALAMVAAAAVALRRAGRRPQTASCDLGAHRLVGMGTAYVVITAAYSMLGSVPPLVLVGAALAVWLLFPRTAVIRAKRTLDQPDEDRAEAVRHVVRAGAARRTLVVIRKAARERVAAGDWMLQKAHQLTEEVESTSEVASVRTPSGAVGTREQAFGCGFSRRPWHRARWSALAAAGMGAPWIILALAGAASEVSGLEEYSLLAILGVVAPLIFRWIGYGFLFGYFFPLLRGQTGLAKGGWFFIAIAAPTAIDALAHPASAQISTLLLSLAQDFAFALTLGLLMDREVLIRHNLTSARLADVHDLGSVTAWASSIAVALAAGVATIIVAGLQPFVIGIIQPPDVPQPPVAVTTTNR